VERIEQLTGRLRVREGAKVERARVLFAQHIDLGAIKAAIGLAGAPGQV
jgi:BioD-like phosphotransacetylase family protein